LRNFIKKQLKKTQSTVINLVINLERFV